MSDFDDLTGPATLSEDDAVADLTEVVDEEEVAVDEVSVVDPVGEADPLLAEEEENEDEDDDEKDIQNLMWEASYGDRE